MKGWIYIATNQSLIGIVKIGFSTKDPKIRISEFNNAGLPYEHKLVYSALVENPYEVEKKVHSKLNSIRENKEWFRCSLQQAIETIKEISNQIYFEEKEISDENQKNNVKIKTLDIELKNTVCNYSHYENCSNPVYINYKGQFLCKEHHIKLKNIRFNKIRNI